MQNDAGEEVPTITTAGALPGSQLAAATGSEVWLKINLRLYAINTAAMFPVVVVMYAAWNVPPMPWVCGITTGLWLGMMHNVIWGMLVWQRPPNDQAQPRGN